ncbi:MAG: heavy-metal-associated domain-containing protein [Flavitalea sp.]
MEPMKFKTNIKCSGCIEQTTPYLNEAVGEKNWSVDVQNPEKILTISADSSVPAEKIITAIEKAGYKAEKV